MALRRQDVERPIRVAVAVADPALRARILAHWRDLDGILVEGAEVADDADIVVFEAAKISDRSSFEKPMEPSVGVRYLVVGGSVVVEEGQIVADVFPGKPILGPGKLSSGKDHQ